MEIGQVLPVKEYNRLMKTKWHNDYDKSKIHERPQLAFYCFFTNVGNYREFGYVGKYKRGVIWRRTKKEILLSEEFKELKINDN